MTDELDLEQGVATTASSPERVSRRQRRGWRRPTIVRRSS